MKTSLADFMRPNELAEIQYYSKFHVDNVLISTRTQYQEIVIVTTPKFGKILIMDKILQSAEFDEHIYQKALIQPAMIHHPYPRKILLLGSGPGASLREIIRYKDVESIDTVDIDKEAHDLFQSHLPEWHQSSFSSPKVAAAFTDARAFLKTCNKKYDLIFSDVCDYAPDGVASHLYNREIFFLMKQCLNPNGFLVVHNGFRLAHSFTDIKKMFNHVAVYSQYIPSFGSSPWGFLIGYDRINEDLAQLDSQCNPFSKTSLSSEKL